MSGIRLERQGPLAILRLDKARGNAIDEPLIESLLEVVTRVEADPGIRGVLLASAHPKLFCPGLDLVTLLDYDRPAMERFMFRFAQALWALYGLPKPVVAAVGGHAVAGGCILVLTADHRVLKRGAQLGLNEVRIGVPLPWSVSVLLRATAAPTALAQVGLLGRNFADEEALTVGLADDLTAAEGFEERCLSRLEEFADKDTLAFSTTKLYLRSEALQAMKAHERARLPDFLDGWFSAATRERIRQIVESLTQGKA